MKITVVGGCGYVGLITGLGFARFGHEVTCVDSNETKVQECGHGIAPIFEDGIVEALATALADGRIRFITEMAEGVQDAEVIFVAVGSPRGEGGAADMSQIEAVIRQLARSAQPGSIIAIKSTVPAGTEGLIQDLLLHADEQQQIDLVVNPEFLREGSGLYDFFHPDRIVIGGGSPHARQVMRDLYGPFLGGAGVHDIDVDISRNVPIIETSIPSAQMIKYGSNAFLATRISFINEIAGVSEVVGADIDAVIEGLGLDPRIGQAYLQPGIGFGGPCLEKDLLALGSFARGHDYEPNFLQAVIDRNDRQVSTVVAKAIKLVGEDTKSRIAVLGLAFKAGTNDVRTSLSIRIIRGLIKAGASVVAHDPVSIPEARELLPEVQYEEDPYAATKDSALLLVLTDWPEYRDLDFELIGRAMERKTVLDGRRSLDRGRLAELGFDVYNIG